MTITGKQAIVTGAGSGIGAALCQRPGRRGRTMSSAPTSTAPPRPAPPRACMVPGTATSAILDVTDPVAVARTRSTPWSARAGQLDLMFNNAGIVWGGDTELLTLEQWNAIIDVNIRGVVHGVTAAYPVMLRQGHGHIINTASMAGLTAAGQLTSYVMTKHAIVGLSLALRSEAVSRGVGVLVGLPGRCRDADSGQRSPIGGFVGRDYFLDGSGVRRRAYSADRLASDTLKAIGRNKALLVKPKQAYASWVFARLAPTFALQRMSIRFISRSAQAAGR